LRFSHIDSGNRPVGHRKRLPQPIANSHACCREFSGKRDQLGTSLSSISSKREASFVSPGKVNNMPLLQVVEVLVVVGVLLWLVNRFIPMQSSIKSILNGVVVIAVVLWLLNAFGLFHSVSRMRIGS